MANRITHYLMLLVLGSGQVAVADISGLPDPTRPANYSVSFSAAPVIARERAEFNVRAIRISEQDRSAIVNGMLVRVGDEVGSAKVSEIKNQEVVLDYERKQVRVPLYASNVDKKFKTAVSTE